MIILLLGLSFGTVIAYTSDLTLLTVSPTLAHACLLGLGNRTVLVTAPHMPALPDPFQLSPQAGQSSAALPQVLPGPLGADHAAQVEHRLYQAAIGIELTQTVDSPGGLTVTRAERAPDVKAALAVLSALKPDKWRDDRPVTAIQFVIHAPPVSASSADWLAQYGPSSGPAGRVIEGTVQTVGLLQNEPGGSVPVVSGPVPDPVAVPQRR